MAVVSLEATLEPNVPNSVMICQTQTNTAERASRLNIQVKITTPWQVVRWRGAVISLNFGPEGKPTLETPRRAWMRPLQITDNTTRFLTNH